MKYLSLKSNWSVTLINKKIIKILSILLVAFIFAILIASVMYSLAVATGKISIDEEYKDVYHQMSMEQMIQ